MFKFTIREAILMTTIVAILLMWWMERSQNAKYEARLTAIETRLPALPKPVVPARAVASTRAPAGITADPLARKAMDPAARWSGPRKAER